MSWFSTSASYITGVHSTTGPHSVRNHEGSTLDKVLIQTLMDPVCFLSIWIPS